MATGPANPQEVIVGSARVELRHVQLREDVVLDELILEGGDIRFDVPEGNEEPRISSGETRIRAVMTEANLNRMVDANLPPDAPVRSLHIALLSGRARISGKALVSIVPFPFSIEATPRVENGVRVVLDCRTATLGVDLPRAVVDIIEQRINDALAIDVSTLEIPVFIDSVKCDPGRLTATGRARVAWPPAVAPAGRPEALARPAHSTPQAGEALTAEETAPQPSIAPGPRADGGANPASAS